MAATTTTPHAPRRIGLHLLLIAGCVITLVPFIWTILASFKTHAEIINPTNQTFFPREFTTQNYETIFNDASLPLGRI